MTKSIEVRKRPLQARSRARVDAILEAATQIISETGSDGLKMSDLAARASVPIGSVYQFFPNKSSIIHTLADESMRRVRSGLILQFSGIESLEDAVAKIEQSVFGYYEYILGEPVFRDIWCSTQGDKLLQEMDVEDSKDNGEILFELLKTFVPKKLHARLSATCFLLMQLTGATVRLAVTQDAQTAKLMLQQYSSMLGSSFSEFAAG